MKLNEESIQGLKLSSINKWLIVLTCLLAAALFASTLYAMKKYSEMTVLTQEYMRLEEQADTVKAASDYLTNEVHEFLITADLSHLEAYFEEANIIKRRENALNELSLQENISYEDVKIAVDESKKLMQREIYTMKLVAAAKGYPMEELPVEVQQMTLDEADTALSSAEKIEKARQMLHDDIYDQSKDTIYENLDSFTQKVLDGIEQKITSGYDTMRSAMWLVRFVLLLLVCLNILVAVVLIYLVMKPLRRFLVNISEKSMLTESGAYEFRHLARVYNEIYSEKAESDHQREMYQYKAEHDAMTGLLNRGAAEEYARALIESDPGNGILILLDLDDLKGINDVLGHDEGDKAIVGIAETMKEHFRDCDILGRLGGDEFLAYLPGAAKNREIISMGLTSLLRKLSGISVGGSQDRRIHCSIGCAVQRHLSNTYEVLFKEADTALYHVKRNGKNQFAFYTSDMEQADYQFQKQRFLTDKNIGKFEAAELQELLESIATFYQMVLSVNLSKNNYHLMEVEAEGTFSQVPTYGHMDEFLKEAVKEIFEEDASEFMQNISRETLMRAYRQGEKSKRHYVRCRFHETYRWVECNVILYTNDQGDICSFTMMRWADEREDELETMRTRSGDARS